MNKIKSRKLLAFGLWTLLVTMYMIFKPVFPDSLITGYTAVTAIYIGGQSLVDSVSKLKGKDDEK